MTVNSQQSTVNSQQSTVNSQQSTVNSQQSLNFIYIFYYIEKTYHLFIKKIINSEKLISWGYYDLF
ncbi:hypothetical protein BHYOB78_00125 [Brachyspira hyodysenteriae ATCC 27164]|uniref:Uncharacterized protein n=1 Tax=Brachyspira hyodysenteriae ATCC 27164 TaxID=1266923 RepID=A0A3B6VPG2_BRAHO|nr:hypothetical protein BHYOB78_00125 [Brachyspira hyodysenteriae ATCC 27164]KLI40491.1 hypothetical protein SZ51_00275 [Brachyspira hyodysenteriae]TVL54662.1 hypothetical protein A9X83_02985 [Brachyspira hyodysenteriae]TVL71660.1 hypothetical protein A9X74_06665 [Brachyspira hyodysenteriae]